MALILGALVGLEREYHGHDAGLRTMAMVSVGACLFTDLGAYLAQGTKTVDQTRIAAQVVTGVGFLGAGAILRDRGGIRGLTTAATVWVVAAIGMAVGFGLYILPIVTTAMVLLALFGIKPLEVRLFGKPHRRATDPDPEDGPGQTP